MLESVTLYHLARAKESRGALNDALSYIQESLKTIESLRAQVISSELRASYFASVYKHSELYIDLLMRLHKLQPDQRFCTLALQASENARARALLEILGETNVRIRQGVDANLLERERSLQLQLSAKAAYELRVRGGKGDAEEIAQVDAEIRALRISYQEVQTLIKQQSPEYATLAQPQPLPVADIQAELGSDTLLLEYTLGEERSYLWALTSDSLAGYELPARSIIEQAARNVYNLLTARQSLSASANYQESIATADSQYWKEAGLLSQMLLGPVAAELGNKRLLIVADGALQYLPFEALPTPALASGLTPLVVNHEIVNLPSASTLAAIRRGGMKSRSAGKLVVVMADPVFARDDPRLSAKQSLSTSIVTPSMAADSPTGNTYHSGEVTTFSRLSGTRQEAEAIMAITPAGTGTMVTDFDACRSTALSGQLGQYQIVHLATHGIIDTEHPELSGIMLSTLSSTGESQNGFLQLHDVYNLDLSGTYLVVLSACRTGLGKEVNGEGLVGLTRGFMYAGARSVVASLWKVDDRATAALMRHFYKAMLVEHLPPAAALRKAKQSMWQEERWHAPYFWAAFVLQGEYRDPIIVAPRSRVESYIPIAVTIFSTLIVVLHGLRYLRRNKLVRS
jgi:CHAT domain-containing protein